MGFLVQVLHGILDPLLLGIDTDFLVLFGVEYHSFLRTFAARDFSVALQSLNGDLLFRHIKAADGWNRSWLSQHLDAAEGGCEQQTQEHCRDLHVEGRGRQLQPESC